MAEIPTNDNETSSFLVDSFEGISSEFTEMQELYSGKFTRLFRAKRYGQWYVLKTLTQERANQSSYMQILRKELEVLMQIRHPHVVQTLGKEKVEGLGSVIVMEYIDGEDLLTMLPKIDEVPLTQRRRMAAELCDALSYVHSLGIVHRDLKPENIMVTRNGGRVKLIDFGMADTDQHAVLKQPAGTLSYMAPEQAQQSKPDLRNDIYSLGLVLRDLQLGKTYDKIIERCLKPIDQRYHSASEVAADMTLAENHKQRLFRWALGIALAVLMMVVVVQAWRIYQLSHDFEGEKDRVEKGREMALVALQEKIERSGIDAHIDTLTNWNYRWPDLNERLLDVNQFVYDYVEKLVPQFEFYDRLQIQEAMLGKYQEWYEHVINHSVAIKRVSDQDVRARFNYNDELINE